MARLRSVVIFCRDVYVMAPFWSLALGIDPVEQDATALADHTLAPGEAVLLRGRGSPDVWVTPVAELGPVSNRMHLDVDGAPQHLAAMLAGGARHVRDEERWTVLADPEGNEFCAVRQHQE